MQNSKNLFLFAALRAIQIRQPFVCLVSGSKKNRILGRKCLNFDFLVVSAQSYRGLKNIIISKAK